MTTGISKIQHYMFCGTVALGRTFPLWQSKTSFQLRLTGGETSDYGAFDALIPITITKPKAILADKGMTIAAFETTCSCPEFCRSSRIERMFGKLKQQHRIATRYDKTVLSFQNFLNLAATQYG